MGSEQSSTKWQTTVHARCANAYLRSPKPNDSDIFIKEFCSEYSDPDTTAKWKCNDHNPFKIKESFVQEKDNKIYACWNIDGTEFCQEATTKEQARERILNYKLIASMNGSRRSKVITQSF